MGFLKPDMPVVDFAEWSQGTRSEKIRPMARHWAEVGFGTPVVMHLFYVFKILLYILGGWLFALATKGIDGFTNVGQWWTEPIVFQKVVLYTMLFEVIGLGCGFGPLNNRFVPPMGSILYWLRPNTIRLPPWPNRIPLTRARARTPIDVVLYGALLVVLVVALFSDGTGPMPSLGTTVGVLPAWQIWTILGLLAVLGLRDKVIFLAARGEVYASFTVAFLFAGYGVDMILAAKLVCVAIWMGAATSKLNKHFPFVISTMMSNNPLVRTKWLKRRFFERFPDDLRPGVGIAVARPFQHRDRDAGAAGAVLLPRRLADGDRGIRHGLLPLRHPVGDPDGSATGVERLHDLLGAGVVRRPRGRRPDRHDHPASRCCSSRFLPPSWCSEICSRARSRSCRACGTTPAIGIPSWWCIKPSANEKIDRGLVAIASMPASQLEKFYGSEEQAQIFLYKGYAFRGFNSHGKALLTLVHHALAGRNEDDYVITEGERLCSTAVGWNFGDGHMHNEQLIAAMQERCHFEPDEVRVILLDAQPIHKQRQEYRLVDAATGEFERGHVNVSDMVTGQPWSDDIPVHVDWSETSKLRTDLDSPQ